MNNPGKVSSAPKRKFLGRCGAVGTMAALSMLAIFPALAAAADLPAPPDVVRAQFLRMCDLAASELEKPVTRFADRKSTETASHHMPFFEDGHAARALCVAFDMTGNPRYLRACKRWTDLMVEFQDRMIPAGAYYMNQGRAPGQDKGQWNVADSGSIGMGVLATAVRCAGRDAAAYQRGLGSAKRFAKLVIDNYCRSDGGITNGCWSGSDKQWWCSTATAGSLLLLLYEETRDEQYLRAGRGALQWMVRQDYRHVRPITFQQRPSGILFYCFELYAAGLPWLDSAPDSRRLAMAQLDLAAGWMREHPIRQEPAVEYDHFDVHVDMAGLPYLKYIFSRRFPRYGDLAVTADEELPRIARWLFSRGDPPVSRLITWEVLTWGMLSYAERLSPGSLFRSSKVAAKH